MSGVTVTLRRHKSVTRTSFIPFNRAFSRGDGDVKLNRRLNRSAENKDGRYWKWNEGQREKEMEGRKEEKGSEMKDGGKWK